MSIRAHFLTAAIAFGAGAIAYSQLPEIPVIGRFLSNRSPSALAPVIEFPKPATISRTSVAFPAPSSPAALSPEQVKEYLVKYPEIVVDYLLTHGDKVRTAYAAMQQRQQDEKYSSYIEKISKNPLINIEGNPNGDVTIVHFYDDNCPYCKAMAKNLVELLKTDPGIKIFYVNDAILGQFSTDAAKLEMASSLKNRFSEFHNALMSNSTLSAAAQKTGLNIDQLKRDANTPAIAAQIAENIAAARSFGFDGTPSSLINGTAFPGLMSLDQLRAIVATARQHRSLSPMPDERSLLQGPSSHPAP